ncbi:X2-like carbohydrate binding domain-containing protein [Clostridium cellulovorans]|uniref:mannan endo-1,4-beta-mannosidase n=2 Tax=Clostridium cellulovorans TaxID=1493 RepID=D9STQ5_CLOC7|nr:X2-like carbohydrate binding domain-containing protein [Clostridium cellulovorans]ADL52789.1 protein of unknown function DUF291 [Clostridium cellulovorans 743B]BAV13033.1 mannanase [Clostridium cellulovorans]
MKKLLSLILTITMVLGMLVPVYGETNAQTAMESITKVPSGFVYREGTKFMLDGNTFYYAGTNNYYLNFKSKAEVDDVIDDAADMGLKVIRTWGFLDVGTLNADGTLTNNVDGSGSKDGVYFQYWDTKTNAPAYNTGDNGLKVLDYAIYKASQKGIRLLIPFTNNWEAFGGMMQYCKWLGLSQKDMFYTNPTIKQYYKNYVNMLLNRTNAYSGIKYKDDPTIFSWELANEPRCGTDTTGDTVVNWSKEMSEYVKTVDPYHMVCLGDEGFYNYAYNTAGIDGTWPYHGSEGIDWNRIVALPTIDFGTIHIYCDQWGTNAAWGTEWIRKHAEDAKALNKPAILEEFGWKDRSTRDQVFTDWLNVIEGNKYSGLELAGDNYWMLAGLQKDGSVYPDYDQYTVYWDVPNNPTATTAKLIQNHATNMTNKNLANIRNKITPSTATYDKNVGKGQSISVTVDPKEGTFAAVKNGTRALVAGADYTVLGNNIIIEKAYLDTLELGSTLLTFDISAGYDPVMAISVIDSNIVVVDSTITPTSVTFDKTVPNDITVTITPNGNLLKTLFNLYTPLVQGTDYVISGNNVTIKQSYLSKLENGTTALTFDFNQGTDPTLIVAVKKSVLPTGFVKADGTKFVVDGHPFYFAGANSYDLFTYGDGSSTSTTTDIETKFMYKSQIDNIMSQMASDGVTVLRTWGFSNETWHGFETAKGVYNEAEFMLFDYIMDSARRNGIKVIITLENYWEAYGGIDKKLQWEGLSGGSHTARAQFFTNENCKAHYKVYAEHFINRVNHYTGVAYKDDPTIFAWDLMNEPRYQDAKVNENATGVTLRKWVDEMGGYIKSIDPNHMVCAGIEGHESRYGFGGDEGNPFIYIQQSPGVDFCSSHPYPDESWANLTPSQNASLMEKWISDAHNIVGKPFVAGEFNTHDNKEAYWVSVFGEIEEHNAAGGLFWEYNFRRLSNFTVVHGDSILEYFKAHSARMSVKNVPENYVTPIKATFDRKADKQEDIALTMKLLEGNTLVAIKNGETQLKQGIDYIVEEEQVVISKNYLGNLPFEDVTFTFDISSGYDPIVTIAITDSGILNSTVTPEVAIFDKNIRKQADITISMTTNGNAFVALKNGATSLIGGTDYTVLGENVVIKKSYLQSQNLGELSLKFDFNQGIDPMLKITVKDSTGEDIIDNFESYSATNPNLQTAYVKNSSGNVVAVMLESAIKGEGSYSMSYAYTIGSPNYAGITKDLSGKSFVGYKGVAFWISPDGSNRDFTIQIKETSGEYWEATYKLSSLVATNVSLEFSKFTHPSWYSGGNGVFDLESITEYSMYIGQGLGTTGGGTIYIDNIKLIDSAIAVIKGDVNGDKIVNAIDLAYLKKYILDNTILINMECADMNNDSKVNAIDLAMLKKVILGVA